MKNTLKFRRWLSLLSVFFVSLSTYAQDPQLPECESIVPFFPLDMTSDPDSTYTTPEVTRLGECCSGGGSGNQTYISFFAELHPDAVMVEIGIAPGYADPGGSGNYNQILGGDLLTSGICQPDIDGGDPVCLQGTSPYKFVYHKPGGNDVAYYFKQVPRPIFPSDQATRYGCPLPLEIYGLNNITIVAIATTGAANLTTCDTYMNKTDIDNPVFNPGSNATYPYTITYRICGVPQAAACGTYQPCKDVVLTVYPPLTVTLPPSEYICSSGADAVVTADPDGGDGNYSYFWVQNLDTVEYIQTLTTGIAGSYTVYVEDGLAHCPAEDASTIVYVADPTEPSAGADQTLCASDGAAQLQGVYDSNSSGHYWSGGDGTFNPDSTNALATYIPSAAEISAGADVVLTFTAQGMGACPDSSDQVTISISSPIVITGNPTDIVCYGGTSTIDVSVSGGRPDPDYIYSWTTGETSQDETVSAGTYILAVTDSYSCQETSTFNVSQPLPIVLNLSNVDEVSGCDGEAHVTISGGDGPYGIVWKDGLNNTVATNVTDVISLCAGIYTVTATDANGCVVSSSTVVNTSACSSFDITLGKTDVDCYGNSTGSASVTAISGGVGPAYSYSWSNGAITSSITNVAAGVYTVTVSDLGTSPNCIEVASILVLEPTVLTNTMTSTNLTSATPPSNDGTATANPSGGTPAPDYIYSWSPGMHPATQTINNLSVGLYTVNISDNNGCNITDQVFINQPPCSDFLIAVNHTDVSCNGENDGTASLFIANGTPNYQIIWSAGPAYDNQLSISNLAAGSYSVQVTDDAGCYSIKNFTITEPAELDLGLAQTDITCFRSADGTIDLTISGGTIPFNYTWNQTTAQGTKFFSNSQDLISLSVATYTVTVTDANGCTATASIGIQQPNQISAEFTQVDNPCFGQNVGSINTIASGGIAPYSYNWTSPGGFSSSSEDLTGLYAGLYELTITDQNDCEVGPLQVYINQPQQLVVVETSNTQVTCAGGSDGSADITVTGGRSPYTYSWSGPGYLSTSEDPTGMPDGTFTAVVTDANFCAISTTVTISTVLDITDPTITCPTNVSVPADLGTCTATGVSLGTPVTTDNCLVSNVSNNAPATFPLGNTIVTWTVTDGLGNTATCTQTVNVFDNQNPTITCPATVTDNPDPGVCTAALTGITLGVPSTGDNCSVASVTNNAPTTFNLGDNTVTWTVTDGSGLQATCNQTVTIVDNQPPSITCPTAVSANTGSNNCIATGINPGVPATGDNCSVASVTNNAPAFFPLGTTTVTWTVTDGSGNTASCNQTVTVTDIINPSIICPSTVTVNADPGLCTAGSVNLNTPLTGDNCSVLSVVNNAPNPFPLGTTIVTWTVTDGSGNTSSCNQTVIVNDTQNPTINCPATVSVTANAGSCGATEVNLGTPVTNDNCSVSTITNNAPLTFLLGTTTVTWTVTDGSGNTATCTQLVTVTDDEVPVIVGCPSNITVSNAPGECESQASWTVPTYTDNCGAVMSFSHEPNSDFFPVGTTTVTYTVTDGSGNQSFCTFTVTVNDTENPVITCPSQIETCNPVVTFNAPTVSDNCGVDMTSLTLSGLPSGSTFPVDTTTNTFEITDIHGNVSTCSFDIIVFPVPAITLISEDVTCNGLNNGSIDATITVGTAPYAYDWSNNEATEDITGLAPGTYTLDVIDYNGCTASASASIAEPEVLTLEATDTHVTCYNAADGAVNLNIDGGNDGYVFDWSNNATTEDVTGLSGGPIDVTVTDAKGCEITYATTIEEPDTLMLSAVTYAAQCGSATGSVILTVTGGTNPYDFAWSDGSDGVNLYNVVSGDYSVTVTDSHGCTNTLVAAISAVNQVEADLFVRDAKCYGENSGEIQAVVQNGYAPFTYDWSDGQSTPTATELVAAAYSVTITDSYGCQVTLTADINQPDSIYIELSSSLYAGGYGVSAYNGADGYINSEVFGGIEPYEYSWLGPNLYESLDQHISGLSAGGYALTVIDANGCKATASARITEPDVLEMPNGFSPNGDGDNDFFDIHGIDAYPDNDLMIYNRWGNVVYDVEGYQNEWNGDNNQGEALPVGTYFAILNVYVNGEKIQTLTGYVDLRK
jgi:gliding motility-associated-like protein